MLFRGWEIKNMNSENEVYPDIYAWVVVHRNSERVMTQAGISFEEKDEECPDSVKVNEIYGEEYYNKRIKITI